MEIVDNRWYTLRMKCRFHKSDSPVVRRFIKATNKMLESSPDYLEIDYYQVEWDKLIVEEANGR